VNSLTDLEARLHGAKVDLNLREINMERFTRKLEQAVFDRDKKQQRVLELENELSNLDKRAGK
jgi:hypothetical protein